MTEATRSPEQRTVPYQAAIRFNAGVGLREIIEATVNDRGREAIGSRALFLSSDTLVFGSEARRDQFEEETINPFIRKNATRIPLLDFVDMQESYEGRGAIRLVFKPAEAAQIALAGLYGRMIEQLRYDDNVLARTVQQRLQTIPGRLALSMPRDFFPEDDIRAQRRDLELRMYAERTQRGAAFVSEPKIARATPR